jgi:thymidylate synthase
MMMQSATRVRKPYVHGSFSSIGEAWAFLMKEIYTSDEVVKTQWGTDTRLINGAMLVINNGRHMLDIDERDGWYTEKRFEAYTKEYTAAFMKESPKRPSYTYYDRIRRYSELDYGEAHAFDVSIDQLREIRKKLVKDYNSYLFSKRLQVITWVPHIDLRTSDVPCLQRIWFYPREDGKVDIHIHYRSWDIYKGFQSNVKGLLIWLMVDMMSICGMTIGDVMLVSDNVHYYLEDEERVERMFKTVC